MKIIFEDKSYIEISKSNTSPNSVFVSVASKTDGKLSVNSAEITEEQLRELIDALNKN